MDNHPLFLREEQSEAREVKCFDNDSQTASILQSESGGSWRAAKHLSETGRSLCVLCRACAVSWQHPGASGVPAGRLHVSWVWKPMVVQAKELWASQPGLCQVESRMEVTLEFCLRALCLVLCCAVRSLGWCLQGWLFILFLAFWVLQFLFPHSTGCRCLPFWSKASW